MLDFSTTDNILKEPNITIDSSITSIDQIRFILPLLELILKQNIKGDVVEFGCYVGESAKYIRKMMNKYESNKIFYAYDSFEGLPDPKEFEIWKKGSLATSEENIKYNFKQNILQEPTIIKKWFKDITNEDLPSSISFAFIDGDLYDSTYQALSKIYNLLSYGGIVCFHDYERPDTPGVKMAIDNFFDNIQKQNRIQYKICNELGIYIHI